LKYMNKKHHLCTFLGSHHIIYNCKFVTKECISGYLLTFSVFLACIGYSQ
jgi:hypothetical protein